MKINNQITKVMATLLMVVAGMLGAKAQVGALTETGAQTVCLGALEEYGVMPTPGSTYTWTITPTTGGNGSIINGAAPNNLISIDWTSVGECTLEVTETNSSNCSNVINKIVITILPLNTVVLTSAVGTDDQKVCIDSPITNITYATTGATGATVTGLPDGVTAVWSGDVVTISGTPTTATGSPFVYTVALNGGCGTITTTGTITVTPLNTIALTSATGTDDQEICQESSLTDIVYATTGATGATVTGLPAGITGNWAADVFTINGTPTESGTFNYTITLTGGCGTVTTTGTITVTKLNTIALTSAVGTDDQKVCIDSPIVDITYATTGATGATVTGLPDGVTAVWSADVVTISGTPTTATGSPFVYTITLTGGCGTITSTGTITVNPLPVTSPIYHK